MLKFIPNIFPENQKQTTSHFKVCKPKGAPKISQISPNARRKAPQGLVLYVRKGIIIFSVPDPCFASTPQGAHGRPQAPKKVPRGTFSIDLGVFVDGIFVCFSFPRAAIVQHTLPTPRGGGSKEGSWGNRKKRLKEYSKKERKK